MTMLTAADTLAILGVGKNRTRLLPVIAPQTPYPKVWAGFKCEVTQVAPVRLSSSNAAQLRHAASGPPPPALPLG
jgi:hypothetical protein